jgi:hypothetical protein
VYFQHQLEMDAIYFTPSLVAVRTGSLLLFIMNDGRIPPNACTGHADGYKYDDVPRKDLDLP